MPAQRLRRRYPLTAKVQMEVVYSDKSKEIVETSELDLSAVPSYGGGDDEAHLRIGVETPRDHIRPAFLDQYRGLAENYLRLDLLLPAKNPNGHLYTTRTIDPPLTRAIMHVMHDGSIEIKDWSEEFAQDYAESYNSLGRIIFFLDIP
jgi:hypothetical protein